MLRDLSAIRANFFDFLEKVAFLLKLSPDSMRDSLLLLEEEQGEPWKLHDPESCSLEKVE